MTPCPGPGNAPGPGSFALVSATRPEVGVAGGDGAIHLEGLQEGGDAVGLPQSVVEWVEV